MRFAPDQIQYGFTQIRLVVFVLGVATFAAGQTSSSKGGNPADISKLVGEWTGESICQIRPSACHDEKALYRIEKSSNSSGKAVKVSGYKIVNGREILKGSGDWTYDRETGTLTWEGPVGVWQLTVQGNKMNGTLTLLDKTVFRRVTLNKEG
jgi:hypothetical protein